MRLTATIAISPVRTKGGKVICAKNTNSGAFAARSRSEKTTTVFVESLTNVFADPELRIVT
jgi:hypothetical protein